MTCPASAPAGGGPYRASSYGRLARGALRFGQRTLKITAAGASAALAADVEPRSRGPLCRPQPGPREPRDAVDGARRA